MNLIDNSLKFDLNQFFNAANLKNNPSPHIYWDKALPQGFYDQVMNNLPDESLFESIGKRTGNIRAKKSRSTINLVTGSSFPLMSDKQRYFWKKVQEVFLSAAFAGRVLGLYSPILKTVCPHINQDSNFYIKFELLKDRTGYGIGPHTDHPKKVLTIMFYLDSSNGGNTLGTSLYKPKIENFTDTTGRHFEYEDFDEVYRAEFKQNSAFSFLRTNNSFHGVNVVKAENVERNVMRWMLWLAK